MADLVHLVPVLPWLGSVALFDWSLWQSALTGMIGCQMAMASWSKAVRSR
jgi:hypothetical protein